MDLIQKIYCPFETTEIKHNGGLFNVDLVKFSLGRQALFQTVQFLNQHFGRKITVAVPGFVCRDVPEAIAAAGGKILWYGINSENLRSVKGIHDVVNDCDALLAINFFGMASELEGLPADKIIIEDNAHGLFSMSADKKWLGTRADFGVFSLRKTLPVGAGAGLFLSEKWKPQFVAEKRPDTRESGINKVTFRKIATVVPASLFLKLLRMKRLFSKVPTEIIFSDYSPECVFYPEDLLQNLSVDSEIQRRRELLALCQSLMSRFGDNLEIFKFNTLEVPYCFPFILKDKSREEEMRKYLNAKGLDLVQWPDLPKRVLQHDEEWYHNVYFIPFLW